MGTAPTLKRTEMAGFTIVYVSALLSSAIKTDILDGPCRLFAALAKTDNAATDFLKLWDNIDPTGGTDDPDYSFKVVSDVWNPIPLDPDGVAFDNGLSMGADSAGGTVLGSDPTAFEVMLVLRRGAS
jgi:hypothetical protein